MSDELVERLLDWPYQGETMAHEAADRIVALTAERDRLTAQLESTLKDRAAVIADRDRAFRLRDMAADASSAFLDKLAVLEAERDRLREALAIIDAIDPEHHIDGCALTVVRGLVLRMGETARAALKGESHE